MQNVLADLALKRLRRVLLKIHVRVGVIAHRFCCGPQLQGLGAVGAALKFLGVEKAIHRRHVPCLQDGQCVARNIDAGNARRKRRVLRQIIDCDGKLLSGGYRTDGKRHDQPSRSYATKSKKLHVRSLPDGCGKGGRSTARQNSSVHSIDPSRS
jgi:hypothetical protein